MRKICGDTENNGLDLEKDFTLENSKDKHSKKVQLAFKSIREEKKPLFWTGKVEGLIKSSKHSKDEMETLLGLLTQRPGEFARRLDKLLRDYPDYSDEIVESFSTVADKVSTPVLLQTLRTSSTEIVKIYAQ